jgi:choline dehydrogenase-like flavoprotein
MQADYIIIGAGSAGCVLADRLSEDGSRVVLLEAGPKDWHPMIHVPAGVLKLLYNPLVNWNYATDPEPGIAGRQIHWPRGRVLGGSSSINGMLWIRGNSADYDGWSQMGCRGWSFAEVMPYFKSIERYAPGEAEQRGKSGPILIEDYRTTLDLTHRFVDAAQQAGIPLTKDLNGPGERPAQPAYRDEGVCHQATVRGQALRRCRLPPGGPGSVGDGRARGDPVGRHSQLAATAAGLRRRSGGAPEVDRDRRRPRSAGGGRQSVRPLRDPHLASRQGRAVDQSAVAPLPAVARAWPAPTSSCCSHRRATTRTSSASWSASPA